MTPTEVLLAEGPTAILGRVRRPLGLGDAENWLGLAEGAALRAHASFEEGDVERGLAWSGCAVTLYDALAADVRERNAFDTYGRLARLDAIRACGPLEGDELRDPAIVFQWAGALLGSSPAEAVGRSEAVLGRLDVGGADALDAEDVVELRALRLIKHRLELVALLAERVEPPRGLGPWLLIRDRLV